jgi:hypothetical protein
MCNNLITVIDKLPGSHRRGQERNLCPPHDPRRITTHPQRHHIPRQRHHMERGIHSRITWKENVIEETTCEQKGKIKHQERVRDLKRIETEFEDSHNYVIEYTPIQTNILYHPNVKITVTGTTHTTHLTLWTVNMDTVSDLFSSIPPSTGCITMEEEESPIVGKKRKCDTVFLEVIMESHVVFTFCSKWNHVN